MLYDVVPPLLFVGSLGGIIFIISRVVTRLRRHELTTALQSAATAHASAPPGQLRPAQSNIRLFGSRLSALKPLMSTIGVQTKHVALASGRLGARAWHRLPKKLPRLPRGETLRGWRRSQTPVTTPEPVTTTLTPAPKSAPQIIKVTTPAAPLARRSLGEGGAQPHITKKVVSPTFFQKKPQLTELEIAQTALQQGNYARVEETLVPYLFKHPSNAAGYVLLGKAAMQQGNWSDALEILEQAVAQDEPPVEAQSLLGISAYHAGQLGRALPALQRAHNQDATNPEVLRCLIKIARTMDNRALVHSIEVEIAALETPAQSVAAH